MGDQGCKPRPNHPGHLRRLSAALQVMWEIWTLGGTPYPGLTLPAIFSGVASGNLRPAKLTDAPAAWVSLMERCWATSPAARPTFSEVELEEGGVAVRRGVIQLGGGCCKPGWCACSLGVSHGVLLGYLPCR